MPGNLVYFNLVSFVHDSVPDVTGPVFTSEVLMAESDRVGDYKELHYREKSLQQCQGHTVFQNEL